jgi:hypothetical protein
MRITSAMSSLSREAIKIKQLAGLVRQAELETLEHSARCDTEAAAHLSQRFDAGREAAMLDPPNRVRRHSAPRVRPASRHARVACYGCACRTSERTRSSSPPQQRVLELIEQRTHVGVALVWTRSEATAQ